MKMNEVIKQQRKTLGYTQEQLAAYLGVTAPAVNKWESGATFPDTALLPALARLLEIDMNTLFDFDETLSDRQIAQFINQLAEIYKGKGVEEVCSAIEKKLRDYPNCGALYQAVAVFLEGSLLMSGLEPEKRQKAESKLLSWYEKAFEYGTDKVKERAAYMLASRYLKLKDFEKARELCCAIPERTALDRRAIEADILMAEEKYEEAAAVLQKCFMSVISEFYMVMLRQVKAELKAGEEERAGYIAAVSKKAAKIFDLWEYQEEILPLQVALYKKDKENSLKLIKQLLEAVLKPWPIQNSPLFNRMKINNSDCAEDMAAVILPPLLTELEKGDDYDFLRDDQNFNQLIQTYREKYR